MKIELRFTDSEPLFAIYGLEGKCVQLDGRTEYALSNDPWVDTLATWITFSIARTDTHWKLGYTSNRHYTKREVQILRTLLEKANQALAHKQPIDLSQEFTALEQIEPFAFGGLYHHVDKRGEPIAIMREKLRNSMTLDEIEADEQLKDWLNGAFKTIRGT